MIARR